MLRWRIGLFLKCRLFHEKYFKATTVLFSSNNMWLRCSQNIPVAAMFCSIALINPVFQNILLYFIKSSTQIHSISVEILSLNTYEYRGTLCFAQVVLNVICKPVIMMIETSFVHLHGVVVFVRWSIFNLGIMLVS